MALPERPRAFVTGGGSGLGRAVALALGRRGGRVLIGDVREDAACDTAEAVRAAGGEAEAFACDVREPERLREAAARMEALWGGTDVLVNNAGVAVGGAVGEVSLEDWRWIVDVNLWGVIHGCHAFVPGMRAARRGYILNVASSASFASFPEMGPYNVTKAAVLALSETLYGELRAAGVKVTALCPTFFPTNLLETMRSPDPRQNERAAALFRRARWTADDVARVALRDLERGALVSIPQSDGRWLWRLKRLFPQLYQGQAARAYASGLIDRWVGLRAPSPTEARSPPQRSRDR